MISLKRTSYCAVFANVFGPRLFIFNNSKYFLFISKSKLWANFRAGPGGSTKPGGATPKGWLCEINSFFVVGLWLVGG